MVPSKVLPARVPMRATGYYNFDDMTLAPTGASIVLNIPKKMITSHLPTLVLFLDTLSRSSLRYENGVKVTFRILSKDKTDLFSLVLKDGEGFDSAIKELSERFRSNQLSYEFGKDLASFHWDDVFDKEFLSLTSEELEAIGEYNYPTNILFVPDNIKVPELTRPNSIVLRFDPVSDRFPLGIDTHEPSQEATDILSEMKELGACEMHQQFVKSFRPYLRSVGPKGLRRIFFKGGNPASFLFTNALSSLLESDSSPERCSAERAYLTGAGYLFGSLGSTYIGLLGRLRSGFKLFSGNRDHLPQARELAGTTAAYYEFMTEQVEREDRTALPKFIRHAFIYHTYIISRHLSKRAYPDYNPDELPSFKDFSHYLERAEATPADFFEAVYRLGSINDETLGKRIRKGSFRQLIVEFESYDEINGQISELHTNKITNISLKDNATGNLTTSLQPDKHHLRYRKTEGSSARMNYPDIFAKESKTDFFIQNLFRVYQPMVEQMKGLSPAEQKREIDRAVSYLAGNRESLFGDSAKKTTLLIAMSILFKGLKGSPEAEHYAAERFVALIISIRSPEEIVFPSNFYYPILGYLKEKGLIDSRLATILFDWSFKVKWLTEKEEGGTNYLRFVDSMVYLWREMWPLLSESDQALLKPMVAKKFFDVNKDLGDLMERSGKGIFDFDLSCLAGGPKEKIDDRLSVIGFVLSVLDKKELVDFVRRYLREDHNDKKHIYRPTFVIRAAAQKLDFDLWKKLAVEIVGMFNDGWKHICRILAVSDELPRRRELLKPLRREMAKQNSWTRYLHKKWDFVEVQDALDVMIADTPDVIVDMFEDTEDFLSGYFSQVTKERLLTSLIDEFYSRMPFPLDAKEIIRELPMHMAIYNEQMHGERVNNLFARFAGTLDSVDKRELEFLSRLFDKLPEKGQVRAIQGLVTYGRKLKGVEFAQFWNSIFVHFYEQIVFIRGNNCTNLLIATMPLFPNLEEIAFDHNIKSATSIIETVYDKWQDAFTGGSLEVDIMLEALTFFMGKLAPTTLLASKEEFFIEAIWAAIGNRLSRKSQDYETAKKVGLIISRSNYKLLASKVFTITIDDGNGRKVSILDPKGFEGILDGFIEEVLAKGERILDSDSKSFLRTGFMEYSLSFQIRHYYERYAKKVLAKELPRSIIVSALAPIRNLYIAKGAAFFVRLGHFTFLADIVTGEEFPKRVRQCAFSFLKKIETDLAERKKKDGFYEAIAGKITEIKEKVPWLRSIEI